VPITDDIDSSKVVDTYSQIVEAVRAVGVIFGDEDVCVLTDRVSARQTKATPCLIRCGSKHAAVSYSRVCVVRIGPRLLRASIAHD